MNADPIFVTIEKHRAAWAEFCRLDDEQPKSAECAQAREAHDAALSALFQIKPATLAGLHAYAVCMSKWFDDGPWGFQDSSHALAIIAEVLGTLEAA